jgi:RNA recognition motif-containing protein
MIAPNNILFVENLTQDITEPILKTIFGKYNGFKEVRLFSGKGIAFIEYDTDLNAGTALLGLNNMSLTNDCILRISFAKK